MEETTSWKKKTQAPKAKPSIDIDQVRSWGLLSYSPSFMIHVRKEGGKK